jgi:hypothetical protein
MQTWNTAVLVFDGVEVLDFAGPHEVFSCAPGGGREESRRTDEGAPFRAFTVAPERREVEEETARCI